MKLPKYNANETRTRLSAEDAQIILCALKHYKEPLLIPTDFVLINKVDKLYHRIMIHFNKLIGKVSDGNEYRTERNGASSID